MESEGRASLWQRTSGHPSFPPLRGRLEVDTVIVGAGITGVTTALLLQGAGQRVAVLEALRIGGGVTGYTTAHLTAAFDAGYRTIASKFGREGARLLAESQQRAITLIEELVDRYGIRCDFVRLPAYLYSEQGTHELEQEALAAREAGLPVTLTHRVPLPFPAKAAVMFPHQGRVHPLRYLMPLAEQIRAGGGHVFENARVTEFEDGEPCIVKTAEGEVRARNIVLATHSPLNRFSLQTMVAAYRSYVVAVRVPGVLEDALFFDTADPYHYLRRVGSPDDNLLLIGGEDHKVGHDRDTEAAFDRLLSYTRERFGEPEEISRWSAQVLEPVDALPFIGLNPHSEHVFVGTGYSGNGMTSGTVAGMLLTDLILGRANPWAALYSPSRIKPLASAKEFVRENVDFPLHIATDWVRPAEERSVAAVPPGEGRIVRVHGHKLAVFHAEDGRFTALSPVCTHLGCQVQWNNAEKSWDCPCHGSRFDTDGEVVDGPAVTALPHHDVTTGKKLEVAQDEEDESPTTKGTPPVLHQ